MSQLYSGDLLEGRYRIGAQIAKGGMSTVYIAVDTRLDREVAVKVMDPALATEPAFRTRFEREARAVARLNHPTLVNVFDQGVDRDYVFLVMELVEGGSLRELLKERGPMPPHAAMAVMQPVLTALSVAHSVGMIHRDLKPDNVLISDRHRVKLADFGLVRATNAVSDHTTGQVIGTVGYLSPEQVRGEQLTQASDVYSAGILLFELLTGAVPFREDNPTDTALARLHRDVPPPSSYIDGIPEDIDDLVLRATHSDPELRFSDGDEFLEEVTRVVEELEIPSFKVPAPQNSAVHRALAGTDFGERKSWDHESMATRAVDIPAQAGPATSQTALQNYDPAAGNYPSPPAPLFPSDDPRNGNDHSMSGTAVAPIPPAPNPYAQPQPEPGAHHGGHPGPPAQAPASRPVPRRAPLTNRSPVKTVLWSVIIALLVAAVVVGAWWFSSGRYGTIPDVVGMDTTAAQVAVEDAGFTSTLDERYDDSAAAQSVMGTDPPFGERATRGTRVAVLVSLGKPTVPELGVAESVTSYTRKLTERTLRLKEGSEVYSNDVAEGHIASISPSSGSEVPTNSTVEVHVSKGPKPVKVPKTSGQEKDNAIRTLEKSGLTVNNIVEEFASDQDGGDAIRTEPAAGTTVPGKSAVTLYVSNAITVPDVEDKSLDEAIQILRNKGLTPVEGEPVEDRNVDAGDVAQQSPSSKTRVNPAGDTTVTLRVSNSQKVPLVLGQTGESARRKLEGLGFNVTLSGDPDGRVYNQSPGPGSAGKRGDTIKINTI